MSDTPDDMRRIASAMSYNNKSPEPSAKHLLLSAAMQIDALQSRLAVMTGLLDRSRIVLSAKVDPGIPCECSTCVLIRDIEAAR